MKLTFTLVAACMVTLLFAQPQIQNSGFENWVNVGDDDEEPDEWSSIKTSDASSFVNQLAPQVCFQSADAHTGAYSTNLTTSETLLPGQLANGLMTCGRVHAEITVENSHVFTDEGNTNWNQAMTSKPDSLVGWFKATTLVMDPGKAEAILHTGAAEMPDFNGNTGNWVGNARFDMPGTTVGAWTRFSAPFNYFNGTIPEHILIVLSCGDSLVTSMGTTAWFDDIALIYNVTPTPSSNVAYVTAQDAYDFTVGYATNGRPNGAVDFNVELSDVNGSFDSPMVIGTINTTAGNGVIECTVPAGTAVGAGYKLRVTNISSFYAPIEVPFEVTNPSPVVRIMPRVFLEGPFDAGSMHDDLRAAGLVPLSEPYTGLGYIFNGGGGETIDAAILNATGSDAIVDWMVLELRDKNNSASVLASRSVLLQSDGDVVDLDGTSEVALSIGDDEYHIAIRHRNHLGVMSLNTIDLNSTGTVIDFSDPATGTYGTEALKDITGTKCMWMGNVVFDAELKYAGSSNDRDPILVAIGEVVPTATTTGYLSEDCTMDGEVKYGGALNDRDPILVNIGGLDANAVRSEQLP